MKKLITLLFISILSLQVYCSAQEILKVDYPAIKEYVTNHNTEFQKLMQRFEENDTLLTRQDHAMLYYGYSFTPAYKGSMDDFQDFRKLIKEEKVLVNDKKVQPSYLVKENDWITVEDNLTFDIDIEGEDIPLDIVYEDQDVIVVK